MAHTVAENHDKFIKLFLDTGYNATLNKKSEQYLKEKRGYLLAVNSYLLINGLNKREMVFMIEKNLDFKPFDEETTSDGFCFILTDDTFTVSELSKSCKSILGLNYELLTEYSNSIGKNIKLDDLFSPKYAQFDLVVPDIEYEVTVTFRKKMDTKHFKEQDFNKNADSLPDDLSMKLINTSYANNVTIKVWAFKKIDKLTSSV